MEARESSRQEIAERLRTNAGDIREKIAIRKINLRDCSVIFKDMMHDVGIGDVVDADYCFDRIADLIDPTCHMCPAHAGGFGCDRCFTWFPDTETKPSFCPSCGARVVNR